MLLHTPFSLIPKNQGLWKVSHFLVLEVLLNGSRVHQLRCHNTAACDLLVPRIKEEKFENLQH